MSGHVQRLGMTLACGVVGLVAMGLNQFRAAQLAPEEIEAARFHSRLVGKCWEYDYGIEFARICEKGTAVTLTLHRIDRLAQHPPKGGYERPR